MSSESRPSKSGIGCLGGENKVNNLLFGSHYKLGDGRTKDNGCTVGAGRAAGVSGPWKPSSKSSKSASSSPSSKSSKSSPNSSSSCSPSSSASADLGLAMEDFLLERVDLGEGTVGDIGSSGSSTIERFSVPERTDNMEEEEKRKEKSRKKEKKKKRGGQATLSYRCLLLLLPAPVEAA